MSNIFTAYKTGLTRLVEQLKNHPRYTEALTLQARLLENIERAEKHSGSDKSSLLCYIRL